MDCLEYEKFDGALCNATLEQGKYFWGALDEINRVTKPVGLLAIGVPGYDLARIDSRKS